MIARAEMSTNAPVEPQSAGATRGMSVALIGPNDAHRQIVARALASADGRKVHEFIDYPATLSDLARMMETKFDVVMVDVDTDESYALQIISKLAELGPAVMAYSARTDEDLLKSCMDAGARDFLPLPSENGSSTSMPVQTKPVPSAPQPVSRPPAPPAPAQKVLPVPPRSNVTPIVPEKRPEPIPEPRAERAPKAQVIAQILKDPDEAKAVALPAIAEPPVDKDFAAWDAANLRRASMPPVPKPEDLPRPKLVPEKRKPSEPVRATPPLAEEPPILEPAPPPIAPPIERPPVSVDIFRSATFQYEPSEAAEKQGAKWMKWILIGAGPVVLALVLLIVFSRSSTANTTSTKTKAVQTASTPAPEKDDPAATNRLIVNATGKNGAKPTATQKPSPAQSGDQTQPTTAQEQDPVDVLPDAMAAQLVAPKRIAGQIKNTASADEPPPNAPPAVALEDNNSVAGSVFGSTAKTKFMPHVVPISAGIATGMLIHKTTPVYPKFAQDAHITGTVVLKATITKQGSIEGIQVISGPKLLAPSAVDAVKTWKYRPYMLDGLPVAVETTITVVFGSK
jgi:protein TonB